MVDFSFQYNPIGSDNNAMVHIAFDGDLDAFVYTRIDFNTSTQRTIQFIELNKKDCH